MIRISRSGPMLALAVIPALAVGSVAIAKPTAKAVNVSCKSVLNDQIDSDGGPVVISADQGAQYGSVKCSKLFGRGVMGDRFVTDASGDLTGTYTQYFQQGTITGKFILVQGDNGQPTPGSFDSATYAGTVTVTGGTGTQTGVTGKGTMKCSTTDSLHVACIEKLKLTP